MHMVKETFSGFFLVIDGIDGCGKSFQAKQLYDHVKKKSIKAHLTAEPTKGEIGQILRKFLQKPDNPTALDALMFAADRLDHCQTEIIPKLKEGYLVISDRYIDSSIIYQSNQGKNENITKSWIRSLNKYAIAPDLKIILDIDPQIALNRKIAQNKANANAMDKFEELEFQQQIRKDFQDLALKNENKKYIIINADQNPDIILHEIIKKINPSLIKKRIISHDLH